MPTRLVLLTSGEGGAATERLRSALESWCRAGLLGAVAWSQAEELAKRGADAESGWADGRNWTNGPLRTAVSTGLSELWLTALRGPDRDSEGAGPAEEEALEAMRALFGSGVAVRSLTVVAPGPGHQFRRGDFSPMWDYHLVHDRRVTADPHSAASDAADGDPLALCATVALCASGGWSSGAAALELPDRADGPIKDPRIVHAQQRVLHAPDLAFLGTPGSPPWPTPKDAGVRRALPGSVPGSALAEGLASQCGFKCRLAPAGEEPESDPGLWDCLFGPLTPPLPRTEAEGALRQLAERTSGFREPDADGMVRLSLKGPATDLGVAELVDHIRRSHFPVGVPAAGAEGATPETWRTVRGAFFGLVDGTEMPAGVSPVTSGEGRDGEVLVWSDPSALAPLHLPDVQPTAFGVEREGRRSSPAGGGAQEPPAHPAAGGAGEVAPTSPTAPETPSRGARDGDAVPMEAETSPAVGDKGRHGAQQPRKTVWEIADRARKADPGKRIGRYWLRGTTGHPDSPQHPDDTTQHPDTTRQPDDTTQHPDTTRQPDDTSQHPDDRGLDEWLTASEDVLPTGGIHDTLMSRLTASLDAAVSRARRNFERNAALRREGDEYPQAKRRRRWTMAALAACGLLLAAAIAAAIDQRWPYLAVTWETLTPFPARPAYDPAIWPIGWFAAIIALAATSGWILHRRITDLRGAVHDLRESERLRREHITNSVHYAAELLRLQNLSDQFADHRRIITEMLHRPFGDPELSRRNRLDAEGLRFEEAPPPSMLVAAADASEERVDDEQRKLRADVTRRGWLTSVHHDVLEAWRSSYTKRVLEDRPDPDSDASISGAVVSRDHRDGSAVLGAREDYANAVDADGWAVRDAHRARWRRLLAEDDDGGDGMERYLALLEALSAVHGPVGIARSAADFLALGPVGAPLAAEEVRHRFSWSDLLSSPAAPQVNAIGAGPDPVTGDAYAGTMMLMSWRLEYSEQVRAEDLRGWAAAAESPAATPSTGGVI
ncbi:MAG: hypothetical protein F4131_15045 [Acidimicrobiaceae bacterium]|nr:hypothetical protein [Acidimicrobiaceae bacterium]